MENFLRRMSATIVGHGLFVFMVALSGLNVGNAHAQNLPLDPQATFRLQGTCNYYSYVGPESKLKRDFESFWNAHSFCNGVEHGNVTATVDTVANVISWDWELAGEANRPYDEISCPPSHTRSGDQCVPNGETDPGKEPGQCPTVGNPCNPANGDKSLTEVDYTGSGPFPLQLKRSYHSLVLQSGRFGLTWHDNYGNPRISLISSGGLTAAKVQRGDGGALYFSLQNGVWVPDADVSDKLVALTDSAGGIIGWSYTSIRDDATEAYDSAGKLTSITKGSGLTQTFAYDGQERLVTVTDPLGHQLQFTYDEANHVSAVTDPAGAVYTYGYDPNNNLASITYPDDTPANPNDNRKRIYIYNEPVNTSGANLPHALTGIVDENDGRYATYKYDTQNRVTTSEHAGGVGKVSLVYNTNGTTTVTDYINAADTPSSTRTYSFQTLFAVAKNTAVSQLCVGCEESESKTTTYDANGRTDITTDVAGTTTDHDYNAQGMLTRKIEAANDVAGKKRTTQTDWHASFAVPTERRTYDAVNVLVGKQAWTYNSRGQNLTATQVDPVTNALRTTTTTYCEQADVTAGTCPLIGLVKAIDGPRTDVSDVTTYAYYTSDDASCAASPTTCSHRKGDLWKVTNALGQITETLKYDGAGRALMVMDANGVVTDLTYHPRGWLSARKVRGTDDASETDDQITRIDYFPTGLVQKTTLPDGSYTAYTYDAAHRLTDITDGEGNKLHYTLDNAGNRTQEDTRGQTGDVLRTLSRVYNQLGRLQTQKDAYAHATGFAYDANGNTDTITDALSRVTDNDYDPLNRLTQTIQNVGGLDVTTRFQYDARDNLTAVIDPKNLTTGYTYNGLGDLTLLSSPDTGVTSYTYDNAGNRQTQTDARGVTTTYSYDALNRLTTVSYPASGLNVGYTYDSAAVACPAGEAFAIGRLSQLTDASGSTRYCYDRFGHLTRKVQVTGGQAFTMRYRYTRAGQLSGVTYPDGSEVDYVGDALGRTTEVGVTRPGGSRQVLLTAASYYPFGPAAEWVFGNGRVFKRSLNQNYQPGFIEDLSPGGLSLGYEFDPIGNLVTLRDGDQSEPPLRRYGYDPLNRLTEARDGVSDALLEGYGYDATGNRLSATNGGVTTGYTIAGTSHRLTEVGGVARSYDNAGNATAIGTAREFVYNDVGRMSQVRQSGAVAMTYAYNGKGEQVRRSHGTSDTVTLYDEAGHWLGEYDSAGVPTQQLVWLDDLPVGLILGPAAANQPLHYLEADALGTPRRVIDPQRNVAVWTWDLTGEAFGNDTPVEDADGDGTPLTFNLRFPGQRYDAATGLNYNYFRDYEKETGRYGQSDPIGLEGGITTYSYTSSAPLSNSDPFGLFNVTAAEIFNGSGYEWRYKFEFMDCRNALLLKGAEKLLRGPAKQFKRLIDKMEPDPAGDADIKDLKERCKCMGYDPALEAFYNEKVGNPGELVSADVAVRALTELRGKLGRMRRLECGECAWNSFYDWDKILSNARARGTQSIHKQAREF